MIKCYEAMAPLKSFLTSGLAIGPTCSVNQPFLTLPVGITIYLYRNHQAFVGRLPTE